MASEKSSSNFRTGEYELHDAPPAYTPVAYTPQAYTPQAYTPQAYTPQAYTPVASSTYSPPPPPQVVNNHQSYASSSRSNVRYENQVSRGPISSIINFAVANVAKATSTAASHTTHGPTRTALGVVEGFVTAHLDKRERKELRREMKQERKEIKREMKQERKVLRKALKRHDNIIIVTPQYHTD